MKNLIRVAALCSLSLLTLSGGAQAQTRSKYDVNSSAVKLGFYSPGGGVARKGGGMQILNFEADTVIQHIPEHNESSVLSIGYIERDGLRIIPVTVSQIIHDEKRTSAYDYYYGYGLGIYSARLNVGGSDTTSGAIKTLIGAHVVFGVSLTETTFVEARYLYPSKYDNKFIGGIQLMFGKRL